MLCLTRHSTEQIIIGDDCIITILKVRVGVVKVGIEAPKSRKVMRSELSDVSVEVIRRRIDSVNDGTGEDYA